MEKKYIPIDLHCHTNHSDGALSVRDVLNLAKQNGAQYQAITDHDTVDGVAEARSIGDELNLNIIGGVEISVTWQKGNLVHIVGLGIDENNQQLVSELAKLRASRLERGRRIGVNLAKIGISGAFEGALALADKPESLSRTHFNRWLINQGYAKEGKAFERYLAPGKPGYTQQTWAELSDCVRWIKESGGIAVIAHPGRYNFTRTKLVRLIEEFKSYGGQGIEVISSSHSLIEQENIASLCTKYDLLASCGSDFHQADGFRKILPGGNKAIPLGLKTVFPYLGIDITQL